MPVIDALSLSVASGVVMACAPWVALPLVRRSARRRYERAVDDRVAGRRGLNGHLTAAGPSVLRGAVPPGLLLGAGLLILALLPTALSPRAGDAYAAGSRGLLALDAVSCLSAGVLLVASARGWRALPRRDERLPALTALLGEQETARRDAAAARAQRGRRRATDYRIERVREMSGPRFEQLCADYFECLGHTVDLTPRSGDGGVDLILTRDGGLVLVQCKQTRKPVGEPVVRDLYGAVHHGGADAGVVCSSNGFTAAATAWAAGKPISLVDGEEIVATLRRGQGAR